MNRLQLAENRHRLRAPGPAAGGLPESLFQTAAFFEFHARGEGAYFEWMDGAQPVASLHLTPQPDGVWRSPLRGTYAGVAMDPALPVSDLVDFLNAVEARVRQLGARGMEVLPAPMAHDPVAFSNQVYALRSLGHDWHQCDLNQSLVVDARPFAVRISRGNRRRLDKCEAAGYRCHPVELSALPRVHETLAANRAARGHRLSMSLQELQAMAEAFPGVMQLFAAERGEEDAAAAVCLRLDARTLYVFYWGDRPGHAAHSPVVAVAQAIYQWAQQQGVALLDVGTSTVDRAPNPGLLHFKRGLGFSESLKLRLEKRW